MKEKSESFWALATCRPWLSSKRIPSVDSSKDTSIIISIYFYQINLKFLLHWFKNSIRAQNTTSIMVSLFRFTLSNLFFYDSKDLYYERIYHVLFYASELYQDIQLNFGLNNLSRLPAVFITELKGRSLLKYQYDPVRQSFFPQLS